MHFSQITTNIEAVWCELISYGHKLSGVDIGIWDGPRRYQIRFLANGQIIETMEVHLCSPADFDNVRRFAKKLCLPAASPYPSVIFSWNETKKLEMPVTIG